MGKKPTSDTSNVPTARTESLGLGLLSTIADTTWRMFVPAVGFTLLGAWLDSTLATKPWLMFVGIGAGLAVAYILVARQIAALKRSDKC